MPLLYGEGDNAFNRLQKEIITNTTDQSIFAWGLEGLYHARSFLARSPHYFADTGQVIPHSSNNTSDSFMTNEGLRLTLPLIKESNGGGITAILACHVKDDEVPLIIMLYQKKDEPMRRWVYKPTTIPLYHVCRAIPETICILADEKIKYPPRLAIRKVGYAISTYPLTNTLSPSLVHRPQL
jgi:hypothetical protein